MKKLLFVISSIFILNACQANSGIKGKTFILDTNKNFTITFDAKEDKFYGKAVNNYFGTYKLDKNNLMLSLDGSTMMMGTVEEMQQEQAYFQNLSKVKTYSLKNRTLEFNGGGVSIKYQEQ